MGANMAENIMKFIRRFMLRNMVYFLHTDICVGIIYMTDLMGSIINNTIWFML